MVNLALNLAFIVTFRGELERIFTKTSEKEAFAMNRSYCRTLAFLVSSFSLLFTITSEGGAQEQALTMFSGRAVDEAGHPVDGLTIAIVPVEDGNGAWFPIHGEPHGAPMAPPTFQAETDSGGYFTITDAIKGPVLLTLLPSDNIDAQLLKARIRGLFFYAGGTWKRGIVFAVEQGEDIGNVAVTVQYPHIRGRVQRADGAPIADGRIKLRLRTVGLHSRSSGSSSFSTDAKGYFRRYVDSGIEAPTFYILSVTYQGQTVRMDPIVLKPGDPTRDLVFTFGTSQDTALPAHLRNFAASASASMGPQVQDVWVINPRNRHAYKQIKCERWESAQAEAAAEDAYLVAINDEAEQEWLQAVFGSQLNWIGLNDIAKEGQWQWDSGEPFTYTNWAAQEPHDTGDGDEDYVIMGPSGKWEDVNPESRKWHVVRTALIEKETPPVKK